MVPPWPHFLQTPGPIFLETSSPTFSATFLIVLGPLEISAEKIGARGFQKNGARGLQKQWGQGGMLRLSLTGLAEYFLVVTSSVNLRISTLEIHKLLAEFYGLAVVV